MPTDHDLGRHLDREEQQRTYEQSVRQSLNTIAADQAPPSLRLGPPVGPADGYALSDAQIVQLLDPLPNTSTGRRWRFGIQLMAVYGLRPQELRSLRIEHRIEAMGLRCQNRPSSPPHASAASRSLHPLLVRDAQGQPLHWELVERIARREALPFLGKEGNAIQAMEAFLESQPTWRQIRAEAENRAEQLSAYSFRHRFARCSHQATIAPADIAATMGHSLDRHLQLYARFATTELASAYGRANALLPVPSPLIVRVPITSLAPRAHSSAGNGGDGQPVAGDRLRGSGDKQKAKVSRHFEYLS